MKRKRKPILVVKINSRCRYKELFSDPSVCVVSTVSNSVKAWQRELSPFILGPCKLYDGTFSTNMENAWQYSKVYDRHGHIDYNENPTKAYFNWARKGWNKQRADRYPMGKGAIPEYSWWNGRKLGYVQARKRIYGPLYARAVMKTTAFIRLGQLYRMHRLLVLLDYDAYDHIADGMTLTDVLNNEDQKMGHAFVLAMLLQDDKALNQFRT